VTRRSHSRRSLSGRVRAGSAPRPVTRRAGAVVLATALAATGALAAFTSAGATTAATTRIVSYQGLSVSVPASWPVIDLAADPTACVRLDQHAVYVGTPGTEQNCPAHLVGRTETVELTPAAPTGPLASGLSADPGASAMVTARAGTVPAAAVSTAGHQIAIAPAASGAQLTVTWGGDEVLAHQIAASAVRRFVVRTPTAAHTPVAAASGVPLYPVGATSTLLQGYAFDTCAAPSVATMQAWKKSSYTGVAVYIGGSNRACGDGNLSASWVDSVVRGEHWKLLPIYVGLQAPCSGSRFARVSYDTATAYSEGAADAADAVSNARSFGLAAGTGIYADMEGYGVSPSCTAGVLSYLSGWTNGLHAAGYLAGVYSSGSSGIYDLGRYFYDSAYTMPDLIWSARWDGVATTADRDLTADEFSTHQRVKQYRGDHDETWGGAKLDIDSDYANSAASTVGYRVLVTRTTEARQRPTATATALASVAADSTVTAACWLPGATKSPLDDWVELTDGGFLPRIFVDMHGQAPPRCGLLYTTWTSANVRTGPGGKYPVVSRIAAGSGGWIVCQAAGQRNRASIVWDLLRSGLWVSDYWMNTPGQATFSSNLPRC
jgi:hypothetical protein